MHTLLLEEKSLTTEVHKRYITLLLRLSMLMVHIYKLCALGSEANSQGSDCIGSFMDLLGMHTLLLKEKLLVTEVQKNGTLHCYCG